MNAHSAARPIPFQAAVCLHAHGLTTRRALEEQFEIEAARASLAGTPLSLLLLDLDSLKAINDQRGHGAGDSAVAATASALR